MLSLFKIVWEHHSVVVTLVSAVTGEGLPFLGVMFLGREVILTKIISVAAPPPYYQILKFRFLNWGRENIETMKELTIVFLVVTNNN